MQLTDAQWARIAPLMPTPRGNCKLTARQVLDGWLFVSTEGCAWRALPTRYGRWHTVYTRGRRWIANGVLAKACEALQEDELAAKLQQQAQREPSPAPRPRRAQRRARSLTPTDQRQAAKT